MKIVEQKHVQYAMDILQGIEDYRVKHRKNPNLKHIYRPIIKKNGKTEGSIYSMVWRMRKEYGLLEDRHMSIDGLGITLRGYRFMEKVASKYPVEPTESELREQFDAPNLLKANITTTQMGQNPLYEMDNKDILIEFMKWIYSLDDEEICDSGWKAKIVNKVETLLRNGETR